MLSRRWQTFSVLTAGVLIGLLGVYRAQVFHSTQPDPARAEAPAASPSFESVAPALAVESRPHVNASNEPVEDRWQRRWRELSALTDEALRDKEREKLLEELAANDPQRAIELAQSETNPEQRAGLLQASLRGWGGANPDAAAAWAQSQTLMDQGQAMASVFHGAARDPEDALRLAAQLSEQDPERKQDYGSFLVQALGRAGEFSKAAAFAAGGAPEVRMDWLNSAYSRWAEDKPQAALEHLAQLSDPEIKRTAFDAAISRWANKDPEAVAKQALTLPAGREQTFALSVALREWSAVDAPGTATWMSRFEPALQLDFGAAIIASHPDALQQPQVATSWAESVVDPRLRVRVLASVVKEWAAIDPVAARQYAESSPNVSTEDRPGVLAAFEPGFNAISLAP